MSVETFTRHRRLLFKVAYDLLGSVDDTEDVLQETWLRWSDADRAAVRDERPYLVRIATNLALNRIRTNQTRQEHLGPWLPEPVLEADPADTVVDAHEREEQVSLAMTVVLQTLSPSERAVFLLREVFGLPHEEVATALDKTPASVRQLAHRAREYVQARRPRFPVDRADQRRITDTLRRAMTAGDHEALLAVLTGDVGLAFDGPRPPRSAWSLRSPAARAYDRRRSRSESPLCSQGHPAAHPRRTT